MTAYIFNIILTISLGFLFFTSHGFQVYQPSHRTVNPDGSATITCEHNEISSSTRDIRLNVVDDVIPTDSSRRTVICKKGMKDCKNIAMYQENPKKWIFILLNIKEEDMGKLYECEFTVMENQLDDTNRGKPTKLLPAPANSNLTRDTTSKPPLPPLQTPAQSHLFRGILIGLLGLMFLYSCVITSFYIRLKSSGREHFAENFAENSTYVEMRKGPQHQHIYCG